MPSEMAQPGYYAVTLSDYGMRAELTAPRAWAAPLHVSPEARPAHVLLDLRPSIYDYPGKVLWSRLRVRADGTVTGFRETRGWAPGRQLYFAMRFSQPMTSHELCEPRSRTWSTRVSRRRRRTMPQRAQVDGRRW